MPLANQESATLVSWKYSKDRIILHINQRFLSLLSSSVSFVNYVIAYLPCSGYPGSVTEERGQPECPQFRAMLFQACGQENEVVVPNTRWHSE